MGYNRRKNHSNLHVDILQGEKRPVYTWLVPTGLTRPILRELPAYE
jgi:hypothetical protein